MTVAQILLKDFSNSAIDLPQWAREQQFVEYANDTKQAWARLFGRHGTGQSLWMEFDSIVNCRGMDPTAMGKALTIDKVAKSLLPIHW